MCLKPDCEIYQNEITSRTGMTLIIEISVKQTNSIEMKHYIWVLKYCDFLSCGESLIRHK